MKIHLKRAATDRLSLCNIWPGENWVLCVGDGCEHLRQHWRLASAHRAAAGNLFEKSKRQAPMSRNHGGARNSAPRHAPNGRASWTSAISSNSTSALMRICCGEHSRMRKSTPVNLAATRKEVSCTPLGRATLLHMCIDYGELEIAQRLLDRGMDVNVRAATDADGFGGHTPIFSTVDPSHTRCVRSTRHPNLTGTTLLRCCSIAEPTSTRAPRFALESTVTSSTSITT